MGLFKKKKWIIKKIINEFTNNIIREKQLITTKKLLKI